MVRGCGIVIPAARARASTVIPGGRHKQTGKSINRLFLGSGISGPAKTGADNLSPIVFSKINTLNFSGYISPISVIGKNLNRHQISIPINSDRPCGIISNRSDNPGAVSAMAIHIQRIVICNRISAGSADKIPTMIWTTTRYFCPSGIITS